MSKSKKASVLGFEQTGALVHGCGIVRGSHPLKIVMVAALGQPAMELAWKPMIPLTEELNTRCHIGFHTQVHHTRILKACMKQPEFIREMNK